MMDNQTFDLYKEGLEAIKYSDDKEAQEKIKAKLIADYGADDEDVKSLLRYHT